MGLRQDGLLLLIPGQRRQKCASNLPQVSPDPQASLLQTQQKDETRLPSEAESDGVEVLQDGAGDLLQAADELAHPRPGRHAVTRRLWGNT